MSTKAPVVVKGKLQLKGGKSASKKTKEPVPTTSHSDVSSTKTPVGGLTESQLKHKRAREELELRQAKKLVSSSYRERVEDFNAKLSRMTEHNDIPRISAAGNG